MIKARKRMRATLPDAEERLHVSLDRLSHAVKGALGSKAEIATLRKENAGLDDRLKDMKGDYQTLDQSFKVLQTTVKAMTRKGRPPSGNLELGEDGEWSEAPQGPDPETEFLKNELERVHKEYKSMDQSFKMLRGQYNELQKTYEEALESVPEEPDLPGEALVATGELKKDLGAQLDKTIAALEKLAS
ncbi:MAG: hypothetical protein E2O91_00795 [Alphaproteobacteria bacterium]|nr:MAG: hypothetical protein E2O91_00795 [Alphaproteobacteria bacterium]